MSQREAGTAETECASIYRDFRGLACGKPGPRPRCRRARARGPRLGGGHVSLAERDGQLEVLLLLPPQPRQPLLLRLLALPLGPRQLLLLIAKLRRKNGGWVTRPRRWLPACWGGEGWGRAAGRGGGGLSWVDGWVRGNAVLGCVREGARCAGEDQETPEALVLVGEGQGTRTPQSCPPVWKGSMH